MEENFKKEYQKSRLIGEILVEQGLIDPEQLTQALEVQRKKGDYICTTIIKLGFAKPQEVFKVLGQQLGVEYVELTKGKIDPKAVEKVPAKIALHYKLMPYKFEGKKLVIALTDPVNIHKLDDLKLLLDIDIKPVLSYEKEILENIHKYYGVGADTLEAIMARTDVGEKTKERASSIEDLELAVEEASIIKFVNQIFTQAVEERATDVHLEPYENELRVRFRIDGFLYELPIPESIKLFHNAIVSRVKIMANLDIAEHRLPQDGRIKIRVKKEELDLRVSVLPSYFGESVQIRILSSKSFLGLEHLGLLEDDLKNIETFLNKPYGIVFVTGPTGSGKSTTLYACLSKKNQPGVKIVTTEDPIEYQMRGITQIQVHPRIGLTFAAGLRSILRHDPDIIMVGEVRDLETAEITIRSAMTGHLVFSTLHTNDAPSAPVRLIEMDIEPFLVASSLEGIVAQRLVRVVCPHCKQPVSVSSGVFVREGLAVDSENVETFTGKGCEKCRFTGFKGRTGIFEILVVNDEIRDLIFKRATSQTIQEKGLSYGMHTLRQDGLRKVLEGITTLSEVMRVT
ncbi:MAG: Flp pilus assembly complex ATPase component TadA [Candidatus Omnitrophota bacterium]|nr:MAG: Flp pilus assembly complex ATPase component TadA [Candidatus Omnitrophota bacterium]